MIEQLKLRKAAQEKGYKLGNLETECPIACALKRKYPTAFSIHVGFSSSKINLIALPLYAGEIIWITNSIVMTRYINRWDRKFKAEPHRFRINI